MPNGRGQIDCSYCLHWEIGEEAWGYASGRYDGKCNCWDIAIPSDLTPDHRFCLDFIPTRYFGEDNGVGLPGEMRSTEQIAQDRLSLCLRLKPDMKSGILYHGPPGNLEQICELMNLNGDDEK